jgi:NHLM bacteriocin system ABC transporter peptidase/ATP-binding protein
MEAVECGAAALGIVLSHYGLRVPLEELRIACGVSRDGSKASNVVKAARGYGMVAKGFRKEPAQLKAMRLPLIVFWNFNHFLVVEGFGKGKVFLNDPAAGPRVAAWEEFDQSFTGVVLTIEPGPDFKKGGVKPSLFGALLRRLSGAYPALAYAVIAGLGLAMLGLIIPTFSRVFVDKVLVGGQPWLVGLLAGMGLAAAMQAIVTWLQQYFLLRLETRMAIGTSGTFLWHVLRLPIEFFTQRYPGDISSRVQINDKVAMLLSGQLANAGLSVMMIAFYAVLMFQYDVLLTLVGIAIAAVNFGFLRYVSRKRVDENQRLLAERGKLTGVTMSGMQTIETIKATGGENDFFARWAGHQAKLLNAQQRLGVSSQVLTAVPPFLMAVNTAAILTIGGLRVMDGSMTMGMLVAFQSLMTSFLTPVNQMVTLGGTVQEVEGDMNRLDDVMRYRTDVQTERVTGTGGGMAKAKLAGYLELRNMSFGYSRLEAPLIEGLSLSLKPGERVALVGGSGSGKSTVAKLVTGLYRPWDGDILLDGRPRGEIPRVVLTNSVAMVDQDIFMFEGTVRENLTIWDATLPEAEVIQAAKDAEIHADIAARSGGYEHVVSEGGANFSGGQRQRLEIARALAGNPSILVLDEATSALDPVTEQAIDANLRRRGCTCLIVAHRLSTIRDCDEIIVLERGKVVERGTHDEMVRANGPYARLIGTEEYQSDRRRSVLDRL